MNKGKKAFEDAGYSYSRERRNNVDQIKYYSNLYGEVVFNLIDRDFTVYMGDGDEAGSIDSKMLTLINTQIADFKTVIVNERLIWSLKDEVDLNDRTVIYERDNRIIIFHKSQEEDGFMDAYRLDAVADNLPKNIIKIEIKERE